MDNICSRCIRLSLRRGNVFPGQVRRTIDRNFSSSRPSLKEETPVTSNSLQRAASREANKVLSDAVRSDKPGQGRPRSTSPDGSPRAQRSPGSVLRQTAAPSGQLLRRSGPPHTGEVLKRSTSPNANRSSGRTGRGNTGGTRLGRGGMMAGRSGGKRHPGSKRITSRGAENDSRSDYAGDGGEDVAQATQDMEQFYDKYIDPPQNPTEPIPYNPQPQAMAELQKDWPNTPLSDAGLTASLIQKVEFLARRIAHGYQSPEQLAEWFHAGNLTRFESEQEMETVLKLATDLAKQRADQLTERKGTLIDAENMEMQSLSSSGDKADLNYLVDDIVKGEYAKPEKQRMPFLDSVLRNLNNNGTYGKAETSKFMAKIEAMMPAGARKVAPGAKAKSAA